MQEEIKKEMLLILQSKQKGDKLSMSTLNELFECGLFSEKSALKFVVKNEYYKMMKRSDISGRSAIIDLSIKWNVTEYFIKDLIYNLRPKK